MSRKSHLQGRGVLFVLLFFFIDETWVSSKNKPILHGIPSIHRGHWAEKWRQSMPCNARDFLYTHYYVKGFLFVQETLLMYIYYLFFFLLVNIIFHPSTQIPMELEIWENINYIKEKRKKKKRKRKKEKKKKKRKRC